MTSLRKRGSLDSRVRGNDDSLTGNRNVMAGELILIIEDNEKNRKLARDVLQVKGYQTIESETAEEGLDLALAKSPALILMDIQLPGIDGITALKQLRLNPKTKSIPVIAITASAMTHNRQTILAEGFDGYQTKPISLKDFLGEVERVLATGRS
jgi:two-component system, cell cycle response regulator DivK